MKTVKVMLVAACVFGSTAASASAVSAQARSHAKGVSTCYYAGRYYTAEATYDVYDCYDNGDGSY